VNSYTPAMKLVMDLSSLQAKMLKRLESQLSVHGISFTEFQVMARLNGAPEKTMRRIELAESISLSASGVTRLLAPMEKRKMVQRQVNARDARVSLVQLSDVGEELFKDSLVTYEHAAAAFMQALDSGQLDQMNKLTEKLL
jgi:DNA-binding MarR family transcriptional regulator